ncbi:MAG: amidohydrolase family protein [Deltaproteobacteria bacterium]|nr:amidohydrolase family protein [Deltaproteobacteria bacterium]
MGILKFIDAHVHGFLKPTDEKRFYHNIHALTKQGLEKIIIAVLPYHNFDYQLKLSLSPYDMQPAISKDNFDETVLLSNWIKKYDFQKIVVPFLDVRFMTEKIREQIVSCKELGFMGIKGAFIPEPDRVLNIQAIPQALGISIDSYYQIQQEIFSCAHELDLPLLYHMNLSQHFDWASKFLNKFPQLRVNIPHLGYSLRRIMDILNRFENTYTDPAFLISLLRKNNQRYLNFIDTYHKRIMMGSDAIISNPIEEITSYVDYFSHLPMSDQVKHNILRENAYTFLSNTTHS